MNLKAADVLVFVANLILLAVYLTVREDVDRWIVRYSR